jgi:predicted LPLAT superfamily acyltransferase
VTPLWRQQDEVGSQIMRRLLVWIALHFGRPLVILILCPTVAYFVLGAGSIRSSSQDYLRRIFGRPATLAEVYRHLFNFAVCSIDRLYFLSGKSRNYEVSVSGEDVFEKYYQQGRGAILMICHMGNFDVMRVRGTCERKFPVKILLSRGHNPGANALLEQLDAELAKNIIDADRSANELVLEIHQALRDGFFVGVMADRARERENMIPCQFLGAAADFPVSPWLISSVLKAPVILCFGLFAGGRRYEIFFEEFSEALQIPRKERPVKLAAEMQRFVGRVECHLKRYPYNWFNFYMFWKK